MLRTDTRSFILILVPVVPSERVREEESMYYMHPRRAVVSAEMWRECDGKMLNRGVHVMAACGEDKTDCQCRYLSKFLEEHEDNRKA